MSFGLLNIHQVLSALAQQNKIQLQDTCHKSSLHECSVFVQTVLLSPVLLYQQGQAKEEKKNYFLYNILQFNGTTTFTNATMKFHEHYN